MIHTVSAVLKLSHAYSFNTLIYRLRKLPVIKYILREDFYKNEVLKSCLNILTVIKDIFKIFLGKFAYLGLFVFIPVYYMPADNFKSFIHLLFCLTLAGALANNELTCATKEKYYAHVLMRVDARRLALSNLLLYVLGQFISFIPAALFFSALCHVPVLYSLCLPLCAAAGKLTWSACSLWIFKKTDILFSERSWKFIYSLLGIAAAAGYGLPFVNIFVPAPAFVTATALLTVASPFALYYLWHAKGYHSLYKKTLTRETIIFNATATVTANQQKSYLSNLSDEKITSSKKGYAYFNDIFVKRHKKLLTTSAKKQTIILLVILAGCITSVFMLPQSKEAFRFVAELMLPYFVFIMYLLNRGGTITQAMFFNCDHSMLTYRFYRQPDKLLSLFKIRLKTMIKINLMPALVIALGLPLLLYLSGGASNPVNYILLPVSILFMSAFFALHYLVMYYLLQPYDIHMTSKSHSYSIAGIITYAFCYLFIQIKMSTFIFSMCVIIFTIVYALLARILVYKYAPKTFRLK